MRESMMAANLPVPEFAQKQIGSHQIHVTLKNNVEHRRTFLNPNVAELIGSDFYDRLSEQEKIIINFGAERTVVSVSDALRIVGKDWQTAKVILEGLVT